jgi:hypothetical protein
VPEAVHGQELVQEVELRQEFGRALKPGLVGQAQDQGYARRQHRDLPQHSAG